MRVLIDARKLDDFGIGTYIRQLLRASAALRPQWQFLLAGAPTQTSGPPPVRAANVEWVTERSAKYSLRELTALSRLATATGADLYHSPHYVFPVRLPCPGVVTVHDCIHLRFPEQLPRPLGILPRRLSAAYARGMLRHAVAAADRVVTVSEATRQDLLTRLGADPERVVAIHNGCDRYFLEAPDPERHDALRARLRLPARYLLFVGNAKPHKNLAGLLAAFGMLAAREPDVELLVAGQIDDFDRRVTAAGDARRRVRNLGFVEREELRVLYREALITCVPSLYEGFGLPVLEAMACGTAVVAANVGGIPEMTADAAVLVDPLDSAGLSAALQAMIEDPEHRERTARAGRARAESFRWSDAAAATLMQYELAGTQSRPGAA